MPPACFVMQDELVDAARKQKSDLSSTDLDALSKYFSSSGTKLPVDLLKLFLKIDEFFFVPLEEAGKLKELLLLNVNLNPEFRRKMMEVFPKIAHLNNFEDFREFQSNERQKIEAMFAMWSSKCCRDYVLTEKIGVMNPSLTREFVEHKTASEDYVYHGTTLGNLKLICKHGFQRKGEIDGGWYGAGYYFTHNPEYAASYIRGQDDRFVQRPPKRPLLKSGSTATLVVSQISSGHQFHMKDIDVGVACTAGFDSHVAFVDEIGRPDDTKDSYADEVVLFDQSRQLPRYLIGMTRAELSIVWRTSYRTNLCTGDIDLIASVLKLGFIHFEFIQEEENDHDSNEAFELLLSKTDAQFRIITSGKGGQKFVKRIRSNNSPIYLRKALVLVFCLNVPRHETWAKKYSHVSVTSDPVRFVEYCKPG